MFNLNIRSDLQEASKYLTRVQRREIPFAAARALTWTAKDAQRANRLKMEQVFDSPTKRTTNAVRIKPAKKRDLTSWVWLKDEAPKGTAPMQYLAPQIYGGKRNHKRFEKALMARGILPRGWWAIPADGARTNRFGNITGGMHQKILSAVGGSRDPRQDSSGSKRARFFVMYEGGKPLGIYERTSKRRIKPWFWFTPDPPDYEKRYPFHKISNQAARRRWRHNFNRSLEKALESIR